MSTKIANWTLCCNDTTIQYRIQQSNSEVWQSEPGPALPGLTLTVLQHPFHAMIREVEAQNNPAKIPIFLTMVSILLNFQIGLLDFRVGVMVKDLADCH